MDARKLILLVLIGSVFYLGCARPAAARIEGACSAGEARAAESDAHRAYVRAAKRYREARHVHAATVAYSLMYGTAVGRWLRLARRSGYSWGEMGTLMRVVDRESGGYPAVPNSAGSGALGLLQVMPEWADGSKQWYWGRWGLAARWDRTSAVQTLAHCVHMSWSNWGE